MVYSKIIDSYLHENKKKYEKEVCEILKGKLHPIQVEEEILPFLDLKKSVPEIYHFSPQNIKTLERSMRKYEFFSIFQNLFFLDLNIFIVQFHQYFQDSEPSPHLLTGLNFSASYLSTPIWKFRHNILFFLVFFPIAFLWILLRNFLLGFVIRIISSLVNLCRWSKPEPKLLHFYCLFGIISFFLLISFWIVYIFYTLAITIREICSWIFAIFFSIKFGSLIHPRKVDDVQKLLKENIDFNNFHKNTRFSALTISEVYMD